VLLLFADRLCWPLTSICAGADFGDILGPDNEADAAADRQQDSQLHPDLFAALPVAVTSSRSNSSAAARSRSGAGSAGSSLGAGSESGSGSGAPAAAMDTAEDDDAPAAPAHDVTRAAAGADSPASAAADSNGRPRRGVFDGSEVLIGTDGELIYSYDPDEAEEHAAAEEEAKLAAAGGELLTRFAQRDCFCGSADLCAHSRRLQIRRRR
jgi:hypothetical protein